MNYPSLAEHDDANYTSVYQSLYTISERISIDKLEISTQNKMKFTARKVIPDKVVHGKWLAMILLCGQDLEITFKIHYNSSVGRKLLSKIVSKDPTEIPHAKIQDYFRELCNTCAGEIKATLSQQDVVIGLSLPLSVRGSDQVMFSQRENYLVHSYFWHIDSDIGPIVASVHVELINPQNLVKIKVPDEPIKTKKRKIAFL